MWYSRQFFSGQEPRTWDALSRFQDSFVPWCRDSFLGKRHIKWCVPSPLGSIRLSKTLPDADICVLFCGVWHNCCPPPSPSLSPGLVRYLLNKRYYRILSCFNRPNHVHGTQRRHLQHLVHMVNHGISDCRWTLKLGLHVTTTHSNAPAFVGWKQNSRKIPWFYSWTMMDKEFVCLVPCRLIANFVWSFVVHSTVPLFRGVTNVIDRNWPPVGFRVAYALLISEVNWNRKVVQASEINVTNRQYCYCGLIVLTTMWSKAIELQKGVERLPNPHRSKGRRKGTDRIIREHRVEENTLWREREGI